MSYQGAILENWKLLNLPTDPEELATLLEVYAKDWSLVLDFLGKMAVRHGIILEVSKVRQIMTERYSEGEK